MAILKNTVINDTGYIEPAKSATVSRPNITTTTIRWTNTGSQSYSVLSGSTPTLTNTSWTAPTGVNEIEVLVVAGGGGGGAVNGYTLGGGGAGGLIYNSKFAVVPGTSYTVTVGQGGAINTNGSNSVFGSLTAIGGGAGSIGTAGGSNGGSGGGGGNGAGAGGSGTAGQGFAGGRGEGSDPRGGGGGGAGGPGSNSPGNNWGGGGGPGLNFSITGTPTWYAGGGGGGSGSNVGSKGGMGGIGGGGKGESADSGDATSGTASTGGGGGGAFQLGGGSGGSGVVVIRYSTVNSQDSRGLVKYNTDTSSYEAYNNTASSWLNQRPEYNHAGHNLYTQSIDLSTGWTSIPYATITSASSILTPDGTGTTYKLAEQAVTNQHFAYKNTSYTTGERYCQSIYVKAAERSIVALAHGSDRCVFNLSTQQIINFDANAVSYGIVDQGNGWYRIWHTTVPGTTTSYVFIYPNAWDGVTQVPSWAGVAGEGFYIWGHQIEQGVASPGPYVAVNGAASPAPVITGGYRIHTYTTTGTSGFTAACTGTVEVLVVAGGGGGGGGGGGAGGLIYKVDQPVIANEKYTVVVGAGGAGGSNTTAGTNGSNSQFGPLIAIGGGGAGADNATGRSGGSGGGGGATSSGTYYPGGYVVGQGYAGGIAPGSTSPYPSAGGGGAGGQGGTPSANSSTSGHGGIGLSISISGQPVWYAGGGGGGKSSTTNGGNGGLGGGGAGTGVSGTANTGGGGGGTNSTTTAGTGGSGIVIVRYRYD